MENILELDEVSVSFGIGYDATHVLKKINLKVKKGEFLAIVGFSGTGKSTLINYRHRILG